MRVDLDYNRPTPKDGQEQISNVALTADYIDYAVSNVYREGLEGQMRRTFGRLQRKLDAAVAEGQSEVDLADDEKDLLRKVFDKYKCPANLAKYFLVLEDEIESATSKKKAVAAESAPA